MAILAGGWLTLAGPAAAAGPYPDPGFPEVPCPSAADTVELTADAQLDPACTYTGGLEITASDVTLDCLGASVAGGTSGVGILIHTAVNQDMSGIVVRNCALSGFLNGIKVTRDGFRDLPAGEEYDNVLEDVSLANNDVADTRGVGIFVDGYVTDTRITGGRVSGAGSSGIYLEAGSADNVVAGNEITDNGFNESGPDGQLIKFGGLQFRYWGTGREGISIDGSRRNVVRDNILEGNSAGGIFLYTNCGEYVDSKPGRYFQRRYGATDNVIARNHLTGGVDGVWVAARMGESVLPMECSDIPYYDSGITQITPDRAAHNTINDNVFEDVTYGVRVEDDDAKVVRNTFSGPDGGHYAVIAGTPYRTSELDEPVSGLQLVDNVSTITDNPSPYRWVEGETGSTVVRNTALGEEVGWCEGESLPRGPYVMTIEIAYEPEGSPVTPTPDPLAIPTVGEQPACPRDEPPTPPSNRFKLGHLKLNKKKGVAALKVEVPGPGRLRLEGRSVRGERKSAGAAGTIKIRVKAKGRKARKLKRRGETWVEARVTFTPAGGDSRTKSRKLKLIRKHSGRRR